MGEKEDWKSFDFNNGSLFQLIPVIYGAVFSYAMYIFSLITVEAYKEWDPLTFNTILMSLSLRKMVIFLGFTIFMLEHVGSMIKLGVRYPFKRSSRYSFEIFIALLYVCTFSLVGAGIYHCTSTFILLMIFNGLWYNQFKEEYNGDESNITAFSRNERDLLYIGAFVLLLENGFFIYLGRFQMDWVNVIVFVSTLFVWMFISSKWAFMRHGENVTKCKVMIFLTPRYINKLRNKQSLIINS